MLDPNLNGPQINERKLIMLFALTLFFLLYLQYATRNITALLQIHR